MVQNGQKLGYVRVSTIRQNPDRQLEGLELDKTFIDTTSGKNTDRPGLTELWEYAREGDIIYVHSLDRLARNLNDLLDLVERFNKRKITLSFVHEHLTFTGDDNPMSKLLLGMLGAVSEFERTLIRERQLEGIAKAKERGVYQDTSYRRKKIKDPDLKTFIKAANAGMTKAEMARMFNVNRSTIYRYLNQYKEKLSCPG